MLVLIRLKNQIVTIYMCFLRELFDFNGLFDLKHGLLTFGEPSMLNCHVLMI